MSCMYCKKRDGAFVCFQICSDCRDKVDKSKCREVCTLFEDIEDCSVIRTQATEQLKPCPFCGAKAETGLNFGRFGIRCTECEANMRSREVGGNFESEEIIKMWNHRTNPTGTSEN